MKPAIKNLLLDALTAQVKGGTYPKPLRTCKRAKPNEVAKVTAQPAAYVYGINEPSDVTANPLQFNELEVAIEILAPATEDTQEAVGIEYAASVEEAVINDDPLEVTVETDSGPATVFANASKLGSRVLVGGTKPEQAAAVVLVKLAYSTGLGTPRGIR